MKKVSIALSIFILFSTSVVAQTCKTNMLPSHPENQYIDNKDGTITDIINELMWSTCSLGQTYREGNCDDEATSFNSWNEALLAAKISESYLAYNDWRLPNIKELGSLVERSCVAPAIDLGLFPKTAALPYWSNTFDGSDINSTIKGLLIHFNNGTETINPIENKKLIRLVRSLPKP